MPTGAFSFHDLIESVAPADYASDYLARFRPNPNDVVIFTTGGTTGAPKGVPRTHNSFLASVPTSTQEVLPGDVRALVTPIGHTMANQGTIGGAMMHGATVVLLPTPRATEMLKAIEKYHITDIDLVPTQLEDLLNCPDLSRYDLCFSQAAHHCRRRLAARDGREGQGVHGVNRRRIRGRRVRIDGRALRGQDGEGRTAHPEGRRRPSGVRGGSLEGDR